MYARNKVEKKRKYYYKPPSIRSSCKRYCHTCKRYCHTCKVRSCDEPTRETCVGKKQLFYYLSAKKKYFIVKKIKTKKRENKYGSQYWECELSQC